MFDLSLMQNSQPPLVLIYLISPFDLFYNLSFQLPFLHLISLLLPSSSSLSFASSSFCLLRWRKKKGPSRSLLQLRMPFISPYIAPNSSSAPLRRQRAPKVLRYCHLQFLFYLRFSNCDTTWSRCTPRGIHRGFVCCFATFLIAFSPLKLFF